MCKNSCDEHICFAIQMQMISTQRKEDSQWIVYPSIRFAVINYIIASLISHKNLKYPRDPRNPTKMQSSFPLSPSSSLSLHCALYSSSPCLHAPAGPAAPALAQPIQSRRPLRAPCVIGPGDSNAPLLFISERRLHHRCVRRAAGTILMVPRTARRNERGLAEKKNNKQSALSLSSSRKPSRCIKAEGRGEEMTVRE